MKERKLLYQADEKPPTALAAGIGTQYAVLAMASLILNPVLIYPSPAAARVRRSRSARRRCRRTFGAAQASMRRFRGCTCTGCRLRVASDCRYPLRGTGA